VTGPCRHAAEPELGAYADQQLEGAARLWWDEHVRGCIRCREEVGRIRVLGAALRASLPVSEPSSALRESVRDLIRGSATDGEVSFPPPQSARPPRRAPPLGTWPSALAAVLLLGVGFGLGRTAGHNGGDSPVEAEVVEAHVRALQVDHLVDVVSSEHHVVKPWFAGKLDFSPPVPDLAPDSFPLVGGRTEYLADRPVAALVYQRGPHRINLFTWPAGGQGACGQEAPAVRHGFNLVRGRTAAMEFWAVSDLNPAELRAFASAWRREAGKGDGTCG
jgi:anti-sigma factor RsiW